MSISRYMLALGASLLLIPATLFAETGSAKLATYAQASGQQYFALSLTPPKVDAAETRDVLVLFDTSASQTGLFRDDALAALDSLLAELAGDRVHLVAVDLWAEPLTQEFVATDSPAVEKALEALRARAPLGATDMAEAMNFAATAFDAESKADRVVVYIGDGQSKANVLQSEEFAELSAALVEQRAPIISFAIGPDRDIPMLAAIANHTGGAVYIDADGHSPQQAGVGLANMARTAVVWPINAELPATVTESYPTSIPPLRSDRDTVVVGRFDEATTFDFEINAATSAGEMTVSFTAEPSKPNADLAFLPQLIDQARLSGGNGMPTLGTVGLMEVGRNMLAQARDLTRLSSQAAASGNSEGARKLAEEALRLDPENRNARTIRDAVSEPEIAPAANDQSSVSKPKFHIASHRVGSSPFRFVHYQPPADDAGSLLQEFESEIGQLLGNEVENRLTEQGIIEAEVEVGLRNAREAMSSNPEGAVRELKALLEGVERAPTLDPAVRAQLSGQITAAIREGQKRKIVLEDRFQQEQEREAAALEREQLLDQLAKNEQKVIQLMDKFDALMAEGRYREAEEEIAEQIREIEPDNPQIRGAQLWSRTKRYYEGIMDVRELRHRNFVDSMFQVEQAAVPFPDEPPIVYPSAEVWERLTISRKKYASVDLAGKGNDSETRIFAELDEPTTLEFIETALSDVVLNLSDRHQIPIVLDTRALDGVGIGSDTPITQSLKGISLRSALRLMLKELELTYVVRDEVLLITTVEEAESQLVTKVYPVADLVLPISSGAGANPFMLGGGLGGQGGFGGGLGGGGGGFGGGGFGGGGFGGGGLGGGGFGGQQGGFFAVDDELRLGSEETESAPATEVKQPFQPKVKIPARYRTIEPLTATPAEGETRGQAWNRYFAELGELSTEDRIEHNSRVRETVRSWMKKKEYDATSDFILAALRQGHPQPWMYEALGIAVQAKYASLRDEPLPKRELERIMMSAIDFSSHPDELLFAATYFSQIGLEERSLKLYREVAAISPNRPEPYIHALRLANRLDDDEHKRWAALGILRQPWPENQTRIEKDAALTAQAMLREMRAEGQESDAQAFRTELRDAVARDCVVKVSWTGDADIDLFVQEPSGSVCSLGQQRSTGGGMILGDTFSRAEDADINGFSEIYVCPQGFSGEYRVLLKRIWGDVTAGKITIDIYTHYGTPQQTHIHRQIPISEKDALVIFDLDEGRRQEALAAEQVAQVARQQFEVNRAVVASQMSSLEYSDAVGELAGDRNRQNQGAGRRNRRGVGFMPVITTLPEGTNMTATAVISADRRYVRITAVPLFSVIGDVSTFNFATGQGGGGAGGQNQNNNNNNGN